MTPAQEILQKCTVEGFNVKLPEGQLDRKLYMEVAKALEMIGGKWKGGKIMAFVFPKDPTELLTTIAGGEKINLKKEFQTFYTPKVLVEEMVTLLNVGKGHTILEPSAGSGAMLRVVHSMYPENKLFFVEKMDTNIMQLEQEFGEEENMFFMHPEEEDFLKLASIRKFDRIIANPPFANNQDIEHVYCMYDYLKPGGRMVVITSKHWEDSKNKKETVFRDWLENINACVKGIPADAFKESGTKIATNMLIINKEE
jgi:type I restriction-modification system DNA methylase subunit